jgi:phage-related minor tail protein
MNEEGRKKLLQRIADHQRKLTSHSDAKDDFATVEGRLANLLEAAKRRIVRQQGGQ